MTGQEVFNYQEEIEHLQDLFVFDFVAVALFQSAERCFELKWLFAAGNQSNRYRRIVLQAGKGIAGHVFKTGKPFLVEDVEGMVGMNDLHDYPIVVSEGLKSFGAIPLYEYNRVKGVLLVGYRTRMKLTAKVFAEFQHVIGPEFGPFYYKEMVKEC